MNDQPDGPERRRPPVLITAVLWLVRLALVVAIVWGAMAGYTHLIETAPTHERRPGQERVAAVEVLELKRTHHTVRIPATGTVVPAHEIALRPEVGGEILEIHPNLDPGGIVEPGQTLVRIDAADYEFAVEEARAQVVQAEYAHKVELGHQEVARHEWNLLGGSDQTTELEEELTLRKPHLRKALADLEAARARLQIAELNLERTRVVCPFRAVVLDRSVSVGAQVNTQTELATLVDAQAFRIEALVPADRLGWIALPDGDKPGAPAIVRPSGALQGKASWNGAVIRRLPALETAGRLARVLVEVPDPLADKAFPLLLGAFVSVEIQGPVLEDLFVLPRAALRDGATVHLLNSESRLELQQPEIVWRNEGSFFVREGLREGDQLVLTDIASPVPGMRLALAGAQPPTATPAGPDPAAMPSGGPPPATGRKPGPPAPAAPIANGSSPKAGEGEES